LEEYEEVDLKNDDLWEQFKEDFESFTEDTFKSANQTLIRKLRTHLRKNGVWVRKERRGGTASQALYQTLLEEDLAPWSETEIRECLKTGEIFDSKRIDYILNNGVRASTSSRSATADTPENADPLEDEQPEAEQPEVERPGAEQGTERPPEKQQQQGHGKEHTSRPCCRLQTGAAASRASCCAASRAFDLLQNLWPPPRAFDRL
jgi:hypothetical protein